MTNGKFFIVDDEDYETAKQFKWSLRGDEDFGHVYTYVARKGLPYKRGVSYKRLILIQCHFEPKSQYQPFIKEVSHIKG